MTPINLLAIDTATEQCSVAVLHGQASFETCVPTPRGHADMVLPMVQEIMAQAGIGIDQLNAIAFGRGPGSFTGVRIAVGVAQGLAYAAELPLLPVSNLAAVAQQGAASLPVGAQVLVCMDARMNEVYTGTFVVNGDGLVAPVAEERVCPPERVEADPVRLSLALGTGFRAYPILRERYSGLTVHPDTLPRAAHIAQLAARDWHAGLAVRADLAAPVYLRDQVVHVKTS